MAEFQVISDAVRRGGGEGHGRRGAVVARKSWGKFSWNVRMEECWIKSGRRARPYQVSVTSQRIRLLK